MDKSKLIALSGVQPGERVKIVEIKGGKGIRTKLAQMGLFPGEVVYVEMKHLKGPVILSQNGIRIGIGYGMASKIFVEPIGE